MPKVDGMWVCSHCGRGFEDALKFRNHGQVHQGYVPAPEDTGDKPDREMITE